MQMQEGWLDPGIFHRALLTGLTPGATYYYRFGSDKLGFSDEFSFRAAPEVGPHTEFRGLMMADCGQAEPDGSMEQSEMAPSLDTVRWMLRDTRENDYALIGHFGDISYARGHVSQWDRCELQPSRLPAFPMPRESLSQPEACLPQRPTPQTGVGAHANSNAAMHLAAGTAPAPGAHLSVSRRRRTGPGWSRLGPGLHVWRTECRGGHSGPAHSPLRRHMHAARSTARGRLCGLLVGIKHRTRPHRGASASLLAHPAAPIHHNIQMHPPPILAPGLPLWPRRHLARTSASAAEWSG